MRQVARRHGVQPFGQGGDGDAILLGGLGLLGLDAGAVLFGRLTLGGGFGLQAVIGDGGVAEHLKGPGHGRQSHDRLRHRSPQEPAGDAHGDRHGERHAAQGQGRPPHGSDDLIRIDA